MKKRIISIDVNQGSKAFFKEKLIYLIDSKKGGYICFSNVHMLIEAYDDKRFAHVVNCATIAFPDGFPVARCFKYFYNIKQERIAGMDFLPYFLKICNEKSFRVAFVGSTPQILNLVQDKINNELHNITITELISPPFNKKWDNISYINKLNQTKTEVVFVALGCPKQEKWMYEHYTRTSAVLFGIGGALNTYVEVVERAPNWMQKNGLEWFFRLIKEPKRMIKRYFYTNIKFIYLLVFYRFKKSE